MSFLTIHTLAGRKTEWKKNQMNSEWKSAGAKKLVISTVTVCFINTQSNEKLAVKWFGAQTSAITDSTLSYEKCEMCCQRSSKADQKKKNI